MKTYKIDDYLVHETAGVCQVKDITERALQGRGSERLYYSLEPIFSHGTTITTPVDTKVRIRDVLEPKDFTDLLEKLPELPVLHEENTRARTELFKEEMAKFDTEALASVLKTVYLRKELRLAEGKKVMASDEKVMQLASKKLFEEMSFVLDRSVGELEKDFYGRLEPERDELIAQLD